jgi:hypothetical protein
MTRRGVVLLISTIHACLRRTGEGDLLLLDASETLDRGGMRDGMSDAARPRPSSSETPSEARGIGIPGLV